MSLKISRPQRNVDMSLPAGHDTIIVTCQNHCQPKNQEEINMRTCIATDKAPKAVGPYSQAVRAGNLLFISGQLPLDPQTMEFVAGGVTEQTRRVLTNISAILEAGSSSLDHVVKTTVLLKNMDDFKAMNQVYAEFFPADPPARSTFQVGRLPLDAMVEIETIAVVP
jgi:2-iminobutanoate/2-iminopropanoate deaminase